MSDHAFLAPSSAARWVLCPAAPTMEHRYPEEGDKAAAEEGTAAHWVMERLLSQLPVEIGHIAPNGVSITREMLEAGYIIFDDVVATLGAHWYNKFEVERRVLIPRVHPVHNWGTPDVKAWDGTTLYLWDFKFGHDYIEVFENWQLIDYAAGCLTEANERCQAAGIAAISESQISVVMRVVQPRSYHRDGPVREWRLAHATMLRDYVFKLSMAADEACGDNPMAKPHPTACEHCKARHACEALQRAAYKGMDIAQRAQASELSPSALGLELRLLYDAEKLIAARKSGLEAQVESLIRKAVPVPHWVLRPGASRSVWTKPDSEIIAMGRMMGVNLAKLPEAITPTQAKNAGLDESIATVYSFKPQGAMKLALDDGSDARKTFLTKE